VPSSSVTVAPASAVPVTSKRAGTSASCAGVWIVGGSGATASIVHVRAAGALRFFALSIATTVKVCSPSGRSR
jgi:hypothetical protein